jgi:hypothetical protein
VLARRPESHERALQRLVDAYEAGVIDLTELTTRGDRVRQRIAYARDELAALEKVLAERRELQLVVARVEDFAQRLRKGLDTLSWDERRTVIRTVVARIEIADDDVTLVYRVPSARPEAAPESGPHPKCRLCLRRQHTAVPDEMSARRWNDPDQPTQERDGLHHEVGAAVGPRSLELV